MENNETTQQARLKFQKLFYEKLSPYLKKKDLKRQVEFKQARKVKNISKLGLFLTTPALILGIANVIYQQITFMQDGDPFIAFFCAFPVFILFIASLAVYINYGNWKKKKFEAEIKKEIMPKVCKTFGNFSWCDTLSKEDTEIFRKSKIIGYWQKVKADDIFFGSYRGVDFSLYDAIFTSEDKDNHTVIKFDGLIAKFKFNKKFSGTTIIRPDNSSHKSPYKELHYSEFEDVNFEKKYDVFTDDDVEARYLITPSFMERLNNLKASFEAKYVNVSFYQEYLILGISVKKDLFSICDLDKPLDDKDQFFEMFREIYSVLQFVSHFKLTQKIGL